ncbi:hypothetical protein U0070_002861 [Myodes glareolus]|uniref:Uncharacterized protein n=1 Tax=Myodes glareolus TaxID=447135 RepID=A0AAW0IHI6_MYOGA
MLGKLGKISNDGVVERIEKRCLELFGRDYCFSVIPNVNGDICGHYPRHIVFLEYESSEKEKDTFQSTVQVSKLQDLIHRSKMARCRGRFVCPVILFKGKQPKTGSGDTHLFDKVRGYDIRLLRYLSVKYICDLMVENKKVKFGMNVTSSEKVDKAQRYADFTLLSIPYPGCEFFKEYKDRDYMAEGLIFNWKQDYVDAPLNIPDFLTHSLNIDWSQYQDGLIHTSLKPAEILYLTVAYDWFLFGHMLVDRLSKGEEHITSEEYCLKTQRRKSLPTRDAGFTMEDICMLRRRDRGSTTSLGSDFSLVLENSPGAVGSFTYEAVELVPAGAPTQAAWMGSSPLEVPKPRSVDHPLPGSSLSTDFGSWQMVTGCGSIQERAVLHTDSSLPFSFPDELPNSSLLTALSDRETRLQEVRSAFLAAYSSTVGLRAVAPSPSGAIGGLLEQFARGVGLRGTSTSAL